MQDVARPAIDPDDADDPNHQPDANADDDDQPPVPGAVTAEDIKMARHMFYGGFFFLPMLWLINYYTYRKQIVKADCPPDLRSHVKQSLTAAIVGTLLFLAWLVTYQVSHHAGAAWTNPLLVNFLATDASSAVGAVE
jgi:presenilin enhancer 2